MKNTDNPAQESSFQVVHMQEKGTPYSVDIKKGKSVRYRP